MKLTVNTCYGTKIDFTEWAWSRFKAVVTIIEAAEIRFE